LPELRAGAPDERQDPEPDAKLDQLLRLKRVLDLAQSSRASDPARPVSPILGRLFARTTSDREAIRLVRAIRRLMPRAPARNVGRPKGPTTKLDSHGAILFVLIDVMGCRPAHALRILGVGRDAPSGSKDFDFVQRRLTTWRHCLAQLTPDQSDAWRSDLTRKVLRFLVSDGKLRTDDFLIQTGATSGELLLTIRPRARTRS